MRAVRHVLVALVAFALAFGPVAGFAMTEPAMQHEMSAGAPDDGSPCSGEAHRGAVDICILKCCIAVAVLVETQPLPAGRTVDADPAASALSPFTRPPDPPPPRA